MYSRKIELRQIQEIGLHKIYDIDDDNNNNETWENISSAQKKRICEAHKE